MSPVGIAADLCLGRNAPPYAQTDPFLRRGPQFEHTYNFQGYMSTLESYLEALEDERQKIEAFKRELPFCMRLLDEAIETSREQLANRLTSSLGQPLQLTCNSIDSANLRKNKLTNEEFVLLKRKRNKLDESSEDEEQQSKRTNQWMETPGERAPARRGADWPWNPATLQRKQEELPLTRRVRDCEIAKSELEYSAGNVANVLANCKEKTKGAFSPYGRELLQQSGKDNVNCVDSSTGKEVSQVSRASKGDLGVNDTVGSRPGEMVESQKEGALPPTGSARTTSAQPQRKARRCWSPELHQRFLSALEQLGGSQVATPKQIRELMNVEGLTNDEVKSHLQKFRLHMRRPNSASQVEAQQGHHLVVFGGIWVPPEYGSHAPATAAAAPPHQQSLDQLYIEAPPAHQKHNLNPPPLLPKDFFSQRSSSSPPPAAPPLLQNSAYQDYKQGSPIYHRLMLDNSAVRYASSGDQGGGESGSEEEGERSESRGMVNGRRQAETRIEEEHEDEEGEEGEEEEEEEDSSEILENSKKLKRLTDLHHEEQENRYNSRRSSRLAASPAKMGPCAMARRLASSTELNMGGSIAASS